MAIHRRDHSIDVMMPVAEEGVAASDDDEEGDDNEEAFARMTQSLDRSRKISHHKLRGGSGGTARVHVQRRKNGVSDRRLSEDITPKKPPKHEKLAKRFSLPQGAGSLLDIFRGSKDIDSPQQQQRQALVTRFFLGKRDLLEGSLLPTSHSEENLASLAKRKSVLARTKALNVDRQSPTMRKKGKKAKTKDLRHFAAHTICVDDPGSLLAMEALLDAEPNRLMGYSSASKECLDVLAGHEHPYSIKMSHVRNAMRDRGSGEDISMLPFDLDNNDQNAVQFVLRQNKKVARKSSCGQCFSFIHALNIV
jgi:hypothetical protein